ncbi:MULTISPECIES: hypothetical protein [unclassified Myroides]|uniref:hypothetical protein n=1 Tax=unclassified Myroides TaxID=2642485 RepID=UPI0015FA2B20|nr:MULTISPECIES: hypothetical protein [unclassified Myroides]MBB1150510.1 hypothetical protein [Myroides sp. NP-2]MDM1407481.1 hypothetical protein [Myroides sp. DF42-4-2]
MKKNYKTLLTVTEAKVPKPELIEKLLTYSKFWSQLAFSEFVETNLKTAKVN